MLSEQERKLIWQAASETENFVHWFFGYMAHTVETLPKEDQDNILNAAERYLKEEEQ